MAIENGKRARVVTPSLRKFDDDVEACFQLLEQGLLKPHQLEKVSDLPWSFGDFADVIPDTTPDLAGEWMISSAKIRHTSKDRLSY